MTSVNAIVAGAGIWGCTVARRLADAGRKVLVSEKRAAVGGNCRCEIGPETGIEVHVYGSHIFHTHNREVWDFVRRFTEFNGYQHKVLANYKGKVYHLPLGLTLINKFFDVELKPNEVEEFLVQPVSHSMGERLRRAGDIAPYRGSNREALFEAFFRGYTSKQWGKAPEEIDPSIIKRVPVRNNYDTNYFNDYWQGIPSDGYNKLFERLLDHPNIAVKTSCSLKLELEKGGLCISDEQNKETVPLLNMNSKLPLYYSGPIDALFGYKFGPLPWRSLRFERETLPVTDYQGTSVVNYAEVDVPYTRIHEFKHYHPEQTWPRPSSLNSQPSTIIMREYPKTWEPGDEPYYPINDSKSLELLKKYQDAVAHFNLTTTSNANLVIGGRLGDYKYQDMDIAMASALGVKI